MHKRYLEYKANEVEDPMHEYHMKKIKRFHLEGLTDDEIAQIMFDDGDFDDQPDAIAYKNHMAALKKLEELEKKEEAKIIIVKDYRNKNDADTNQTSGD